MTRFALALLCGVAALGTVSAQAADLLVNDQPSINNSYSLGTGGWDGFYAGVFAGYGFGGIDQTNSTNTADLAGWLGGIVGGANISVGQGVVLGAAADLALSGVGVDDDSGWGYKNSWVGTVRGRVGMDAGAFLPYVTAGLAFGSGTVEHGGLKDSNLHVGWTIGAGVEISLMQNLSLDVQYRYVDLGKQDYNVDSLTPTVAFASSAITAGLNYKF